MGQISVVIPALNAANTLPWTMSALAGAGEVIVVDGGSQDTTIADARRMGASVVTGPRGRGTQLAAGIAAAQHPWLLLLHADTCLTPEWRAAATSLMEQGDGRAGYFRLAFDSTNSRARRLERIVAWRSRRLGLPYGDQGLLISRVLLDGIGGVRPLPLMEDVDLARRLGRSRLIALDATALTSAVRYERDGWTVRSARNLLCLALWFLGAPPRLIARIY